jgi:hypothetical protein
MANNRQQQTAQGGRGSRRAGRTGRGPRRNTGGSPSLPVAGAEPKYSDPRAVIPSPRKITGFRRIGRRVILVGEATWFPIPDYWEILWDNHQITYVPRLEQVLSRLTGAGCDTITIERKAGH